MINWISNKIDYKKESASPPPQELWKFILWSCGGTWKFIFLGAAASTLAGSFEMITTIALGWVVDAAQVADDRNFFFNINCFNSHRQRNFLIILILKAPSLLRCCES